MPKKLTIRQIAESAEILRYCYKQDVLEFEYRRGNSTGKLTRIRFGRNEAGRPTKRIIECLDNGTLTNYDRKYEFEINAVTSMLTGARSELP